MPASAPGARSALAAAVGVAVLFAGAVLLRLIGIGFTLPHIPEQDGMILPRQVALIRSANATPHHDDNWAFYPHLVAYVTALRDAPPHLAAHDADLAHHLACAAAPCVAVRTTAAWLSALIVPATWLLARRFLGRGGAFLATTWIATSLLHVWYSQEARPHGPAATGALFAVVAALWVCRTGSLFAYLAAGIATGIAIGTLQSGAAVLLPLAAAHFLAPKSSRARGFAYLALALLTIAIAYVLFYPSVAGDTASPNVPMLKFRGANFEFFGHTIFLGMFNGQGFRSVFGTLWDLEPLMTILAGLALVGWLVRRRDLSSPRHWRENPELLVVLAYVVPYTIVIGMYERTYERFVIQLVPFVACLAAWGVSSAFEWALRQRMPRALLVAASVVLVALPAWASIELVRLRAAPDTATTAADWIRTELDPQKDRILLIPFLDLPLFRNADALARDRNTGVSTPWRDYQHELGAAPANEPGFGLYNMSIGRAEVREAIERDPIAHMRSLGAEYVALSRPDPTLGPDLLRTVHRALEAQAELVHRSPPEGVAGAFDGTTDHGLVPWSWRCLHGFSQVGCVIEIYRLR